MKTVSPSELKNLLSGGDVDLIDVRTPVEFAEVHVRGARLVPLDQFDASAFRDRGKQLLVICKSGARAKTACERLIAAGCENFALVEGGTAACVDAGLAVERKADVISLERQVRIAVGTLVLIATILALAVHPLFVLLCGVFGAGLVFAGITNFCGLGMLLARMPWNKHHAVACCSR